MFTNQGIKFFIEKNRIKGGGKMLKKLWKAGLIIMLISMSSLGAEKTFNDYVLKQIKTYPTDGSYTYEWSNYPGVTQDLVYQGITLVKGDPRHRSYCSGITFEVFFISYMNYVKANGLPDSIGNLSFAQVEFFRRAWYGTSGDRKTIKTALEAWGLGCEVNDWEKVRPGDFVQIWRHSGSGHTVIFLEWLKNTSNEIVGIKYWSSNYGLGPSEAQEYFGLTGKSIIKEQTYCLRVIEPKDWWEKNG